MNAPLEYAFAWFTMPAPALAASCAMAAAFSAWFSLAPPSITIPASASSATNMTASIRVSEPSSWREPGNLILCSLPGSSGF